MTFQTGSKRLSFHTHPSHLMFSTSFMVKIPSQNWLIMELTKAMETKKHFHVWRAEGREILLRIKRAKDALAKVAGGNNYA